MTMPQDEALPQLLELLYAAAVEPAGWPAFLDALSASFGAANGALHSFDRELNRLGVVMNFGADPAYQASFLTHYSHINPYAKGSADLELGVVVPASAAISVEAVERTEFFNDWMRPQGIPTDHLGVRLFDNGTEHVLLAVAPQASVFERHRECYERQLARLVPHMMRALAINQLVSRTQANQRITDAVLDAWTSAVFVLDRCRRPLRLNKHAENLLRTGVLGFDREYVLRPPRPDEAAALEAAISTALAFGVRGAAGPLRLTSHDGSIYLAWLVALRAPDDGGSSPLVARSMNGSDPALLLMVAPMRGAVAIPADVIRTALGLTAAEARVVSMLVAGQSVADCAEATGLSPYTVRNQLASVFSKTNTSRQSELVALVIRTLGQPFGGED